MTQALEFDPVSSTFFDDPYDLYGRLRNDDPVHYNEAQNFYAVSRYDDVRQGLRDWQNFTSTRGSNLAMLQSDAPSPDLDMMHMMDPPKHLRLRSLISRGFQPNQVADLEPMVEGVITGYLDELSGRDEFDVVADFSAHFPMEVISRILGVPESDRQIVRHRVDLLLHRELGQILLSEESAQAWNESLSYFHELVAYKRAHPADDIISRLTLVEVDRGDGEPTRLTNKEIAGFAQLLGGAGAETVTKLVGNAAVLFSRNPSEWHEVLDDADLIPNAVEEVLRYWAPVQYVVRSAVTTTQFQDRSIPAGSPVIFLVGSATRDDRQFVDADTFDVQRKPGVALGFGSGVHVCLGAALARLEAKIAIREIAKRWPDFDVDEAGLRRVTMTGVAGYSNVPVRV